ncbi:hypothetical protein [Roseovarius nubinhibens]|uniref:Uncharacterized protein n=1 Tax=Roseovarius nubinhibens TaxID=314263 RepID=A0A348W9P8_9RHOB|nr:hypothetical protein [Roseovarius nubinhibens]|tara:strand:- start:80 stop:622 length:543 start_codon:yes stop_codon:yes gene_type:complete
MISKNVTTLIEKLRVTENRTSLLNAFDNALNYKERGKIEEHEFELISSEVEKRLREIAPAQATKKFGPKDGEALRVLSEVYEQLKEDFDLGQNRVGNGVKVGGYMINGTRFVDRYISYKGVNNINVSLAWLQITPDEPPYLELLVRQVGDVGADPLRHEKFAKISDAVTAYRAELDKIVT